MDIGQTPPVNLPASSALSVSGQLAAINISGEQTNLPVAAGAFPSDSVTPQPLRTVLLPYERAYMLATFPRKKWDEWAWAAFGGSIAAFPSAADAILSGYKQDPFSLSWFQSIQVLIFVGFLVWFFVSRAYSKSEKTSVEYLNELYSLPNSKKQKWWVAEKS